MRRLTRASSLLLAPLVGGVVACAAMNPGSSSPSAGEDTQDVCIGSPVPTGWLIANTRWDRERCPQSAGQGDNILTLWRYDDKPVGTEQQVCERSPTPTGWVASRHRWDASSCRFGRGIEIANVKTIKRVS